MKSPLFLLFALLCPFFLFAQLHDNTWLVGYGGPPSGDKFGLSMLKFDSGSIKVSEGSDVTYEFYVNASMFSDANGKLFAYFNGIDLHNAAHKIMQNGKGFDKEIVQNARYYSDDAIAQGSFFLEWPEHPDSILLLYLGKAYSDELDIYAQNFSYAVIDRKANGGLGKVVAREQNITEDTIALQTIAVKHANGRDWWVPIRRLDGTRFYYFLVSPNGIGLSHLQTVNIPVIHGLGQSAFSSNGQYFAVFNAISDTDGSYLDVFDFDRCEGYLSNQRHLVFPIVKPGGVAFSPNSRFLYMAIRDTLIQYDMENADFNSSKEIIYIRSPNPGIFQATYFMPQLAPDQRIYISATNGIQYLHVINNPDEAGIACGFRHQGLKIPTYNQSSIPNFPNYRLGPLDGSPCDTLGLDNRPVAWYRYTPDTLDHLKVAFHDLSYYEPTAWAWDFGDGQKSTERYPTHQFDTAGVYQVCLTVSNANSSSTHCKTLQFSVSSTDDPALQSQIAVLPNPFAERLAVLWSAELSGAVFHLYDLMGRKVFTERIALGMNEIDTSTLSPGVYFWAVDMGGVRLKSGKVMKLR